MYRQIVDTRVRIICYIVCILFTNQICNGQIGNLNPDNVSGIALKSVQLIFDGDYTREMISKFDGTGSEVVIEDPSLIAKFFNLMTDCQSIDVGRDNVMSDIETILFANGEPFISNPMKLEPDLYGIIYFKDGRPAKPFWINWNYIEIDDEVRQISKEMESFINEIIETQHAENNHIIETIRKWESMNPESTNISSMELYFFPDEEKQPTTRQSFIYALRNRQVGKYQILDPAEIKIINDRLYKMPIIKTLNYSVISPQKIGRIGEGGKMIWEEIGSRVIGFLKITRVNEKTPEIIWIAPAVIERDHYQMIPPGFSKTPYDYLFQ